LKSSRKKGKGGRVDQSSKEWTEGEETPRFRTRQGHERRLNSGEKEDNLPGTVRKRGRNHFSLTLKLED